MQEIRLETTFSLSREVPVAEPAPEPRLVDSLEPGALVLGSIREACFVRKLAGGGAVLHCEAPLAIGARLELELAAGHHLSGTVAWREGCAVGLSFDTPLDVFSIIARNLVSQPGERRRLPRIELRCPALLESGGKTERIATRDISQGGARIETRANLASGARVRLTLDGFLPIEAVVRWCDGDQAGLAFEPELNWQELMPWLKERRDAALARDEAPRTPVPPPPGPAASPAPSPQGSVALNLPARVREGTRRWAIEVAAITTHHVEFESFAALRLGTLLWVVLPGLEGWPARVIEIDGYRFTCAFTQPLHPAVLERILAAARG